MVIKYISEKEIYIDDAHMLIGDDDIMYITSGYNHTQKQAETISKTIINILDKRNLSIKMFLNISCGNKPETPARRVFYELLKHQKIEKIAVYGATSFNRIIASFIVGVVGTRNINFFKEKEEAMNWLKNKGN